SEVPTDVIIHNAIPPVWYYYHGPAPASYFPSRPYSEANVVDELNAVTAGSARLWYLADLEIPNDPDGYVETQLRLHARQLEEKTFGPIRVQLWELPGSSPFRQAVFQPVSINFADEFAVDGFSVSGDPIGGNLVDVELNLRSLGVPKADDGFWVALADQDGQHWGRADVRPHDTGLRLSGGWSAQTLVVVRFDLPVAVGTPPGRYRLVVGAYRLADLAGLDVLDSARHPIGQEGSLGYIDVPALGEQIADSTMTGLPAVDAAPGLVLTNRRIDSLEVSPGDRIPLTLVWRASRQLADLSATVTLTSANGQIVGNSTRPVGGTFSLPKWPLDRVVREQRLVEVAPSANAGDALVSLQVAGGPEISLGTIKIREVTRVFAAPTLGHPLTARFGQSISVVGFDLSAPVASPGGELTASIGWRADQPISTSYHVFLHLLDASDKIWGQWDGVPRNWSYPMTAWLPGEYVLDTYKLPISPRVPLGNLRLEVGLYDAVSGQRVSVVSPASAASADHLVLGEIRIVPP
ncbi:MAG TPA: hypothetical protein VKT80_11705, partial [Chloroflexota bacterium]|nr:hypothetical protein [Chloroflexota bacterium]